VHRVKTEAHDVSKWVYEGAWGILARWFRVPKEAPELPLHEGEQLSSFHPALGYLRLQKLGFWILFTIIDIGLIGFWVAITIGWPPGGLLALPILLLAVFVPGCIAYLAIHLHFDSTWYVMNERSLRIRKGIWIIREMTFTFENVQNVTVKQGPLQRFFGIADVLVDTAGGGGQVPGGGAHAATLHQGQLEGVDNAPEIRDAILARLRHSRTAGLGDDAVTSHHPPVWTPRHLAVLREIRDAAAAVASK
jgi:membrane protein YdbS with pleckstrin-like domain